MATVYRLEPARRTLHGYFSRDLEPILTIDPGDSVHYRTLDGNWGIEPFVGGDYRERRQFEGRVEGLDDGHPMMGPIFIRGAQPGMTLEIQIGVIRPGVWGGTLAGGWPHAVNKRLGVTGKGIVHAWTLDAETMTGRNHLGHTVTLRPFMGILGMPPDEPGKHSTTPPRVTGGNLDCKELVSGSTLYLPIQVRGALFSVGDGHAAQGDGEVSVTAIECPMEHVELTFNLRDDFPVATPVAMTPVGWLTMGLDQDLNEAAYMALEAMLTLMQRLYGLARLDALALASPTVDLRITQIVNEVRGVHAILPHGAIR
jgi:acetamidase/formamidase